MRKQFITAILASSLLIPTAAFADSQGLYKGATGIAGGYDPIAHIKDDIDHCKGGPKACIDQIKTRVDAIKEGIKQGRISPASVADVNNAHDDAIQEGKGYTDKTRDNAMQQGKNYVDDKYNEVNESINAASQDGKNYTNQVGAQTLQSANNYTDLRYNQLNGKIKKLRARADSGIAGATAIASLPFDSTRPNSVAGGLGVAKNKVAGAIGLQHNFTQNWHARTTVSVSDNYVQGGAGVGYSW